MNEIWPILAGLGAVIAALATALTVVAKKALELRASVKPLQAENAVLRASVPPSARMPFEARQSGEWPDVGDTLRAVAPPPPRPPMSSNEVDLFLAEQVAELNRRFKQRCDELQDQIDMLRINKVHGIAKLSDRPDD